MSKQSLISAVVAILLPVTVFIFIGAFAKPPSNETSSTGMILAQTNSVAPDSTPPATPNPTARLTAAR